MVDEETGGYGTRLFKRLQQQGLSRAQIYKALSLQRLSEEVTKMAGRAGLNEAILLEISKVKNHTSQKAVAETIIEHKLPMPWIREVTRLIRMAEKHDSDLARSKIWDFFFNMKDRLGERGPNKDLLIKLKEFRESVLTEGEENTDATGVGLEAVESDSERERHIVKFDKLGLLPGKGLDVGTANIVAAGRQKEGATVFNIQRNHFLDLRDDRFTKKILAKLSIDWTAHNNRLYVIGDPAFELANVFEKEIRRPMRDGMISPYEAEALVIVNQLIGRLMGSPGIPGEIAAFSVPAAPIDMDRDTVYHQGVLESLLRRLGYTPKAIVEGHAVVFSELEAEQYTGIGISCGGGMFNVCVSYRSIPALAFATQRGGDWVDNSVAKAVGLTPSQVCAIKESGLDLANPHGRIEDAIVIYYRNLIQYTIDQIRRRIENQDVLPSFDEPAILVCAGGTSLIGGFIEVFRQEIERATFPMELKEIRLAKDPIHTVAMGCLAAAQQETVARYGRRLEQGAAVRENVVERPPFSVDVLDKVRQPEPSADDLDQVELDEDEIEVEEEGTNGASGTE
jgi:hypothetical protein